MTTRWADCDAPVIRQPDTTRGERRNVLMEPWRVRVRGREFLLERGTTTDGASIPRFLWRVCGHPLQAPRIYAALLHDWLYEFGWSIGISRKEADRIYRALLRHFGISAWRAGVEYTALRLCGAGHYKKGNK